MTSFELEYKCLELKSQRHQLSNTFTFSTEELFKTPWTEDVDMTKTSSSNMIEPIVSRKFDNIIHHYNPLNRRQHVHKHTGQNYQSITFQISKNTSPKYPKEKFIGCGIDSK